MELIRENVHMLQVKSKATNQLTYDEAYNVPDAKPDIGRMIQNKGEVQIEEIKMGEGNAYITGNLVVDLLYVGDEKNTVVHSLTAKLPIEATMYLEGIQSGDKLCLSWEIEDLSLHVINSRKMNIKSIVTFYASVDELKDIQIPQGISDETVSLKKKTIPIMGLITNKKDTMRIKEEITLASNKPNIAQVVWYTIEVRGLDIRTQDDRLDVKGEMFVFVLYYGESDGNPLQWLEYSIPFHGEVECAGCAFDMIPNVEVLLVQQTLEVKPDSDGEERILQVEGVLELNIRIYEEKEHTLLLDLYTPLCDLRPVIQEQTLESLLVRNFSKCRINERVHVAQSQEKVLQVCHSHGNVKIDRAGIVKDGIYVEGAVQVKILYIIGDDRMPFYSMETMLPFSHTIEAIGIHENCAYHLRPDLEQLSTTMLDSNEIEVKAVLNLNALVLCRNTEKIMESIEEIPWDMEKIRNMPGISIYIVRPQDTLWDIAKAFYTTVEEIKAMNHLENEKITPYQPLLLVKKVEN